MKNLFLVFLTLFFLNDLDAQRRSKYRSQSDYVTISPVKRLTSSRVLSKKGISVYNNSGDKVRLNRRFKQRLSKMHFVEYSDGTVKVFKKRPQKLRKFKGQKAPNANVLINTSIVYVNNSLVGRYGNYSGVSARDDDNEGGSSGGGNDGSGTDTDEDSDSEDKPDPDTDEKPTPGDTEEDPCADADCTGCGCGDCECCGCFTVTFEEDEDNKGGPTPDVGGGRHPTW